MTDPDIEQLRDLYARHRQGLFTLALAITRRQERAEDAVHEAFAKLCAPRRQAAGSVPDGDGADDPAGLVGAADPVAYAYRVVRYAAIDQVRRYWPGGNRTVLASDHDGYDAGGTDCLPGRSIFDLPSADDRFDPQARSIEAETARYVARSLEQLPGDQREAVALRVYAGLTFEQIAAVVSAPLSTVAARYRRALDRLRPCLEKLL